MKLVSLAVFLCLVLRNSAHPEAAPKQWAVLVAGSSGWENYRHQADVCHAYQILHRHGIPDERIIVMMFDDIANNTFNPFPGKIYNTETGPDLYEGVLKDYTGPNEVTPEYFVHVLLGNDKAMQGIGSGKVLKSGPNDHVFIYFTDHGDVGLIGFPDGELYAKDLIKTLKRMHMERKFKKLVFYLEACYSGTMFKGLLPDSWNIYATTAANSEESSWACDCPIRGDPDTKRAIRLRTCLNDCYSVNWLSDSDRVSLKEETLFEQFTFVRELSKLQAHEHCMEWGDLELAKSHKLSEFMGPKPASKHYYAPPGVPPQGEALQVEKYLLKFQGKDEELHQLEQDQQLFKARFHRLVSDVLIEIGAGVEGRNFVFENTPDAITDTTCHKHLAQTFRSHCKSLTKLSRGVKYLYAFENICRLRHRYGNQFGIEEVSAAIQKYC